MKISRHVLTLALGSSLVACTGTTDPVDTGTPVDTSTPEDTGVDTDTEPEPYCGDGTVDQGEACDDGDANGPDGSCGDDCTWNGWVTCDLLNGPAHTLDTTTAQPDGNFHLAARFTGGSVIETSCAGTPTQNAVVTFTLPAAGSYRLSTANPQTTVATALSLRTDCDDRAELSCDVGGTATAVGAQVFIENGEAGATYVAIIENLGEDDGNWHLSLSPIDGVAGEGDSCTDALPCEDGTVCSDGTCLPLEAPVITGSTLLQSDYYDYALQLTGTDANRDLRWLTVPSFTDIYSDVWGDDAGEDAIDVAFEVTWTGDTFVATAALPISFYDTGMADLVTVDVVLTDAAGLASNTVTLTYPEAVTSAAQDYVGDACDMCVDCSGNTNGFPRYCNPNAHTDPNDSTVQLPGMECTWDDRSGTTATCQDRNVNDPMEVNDLSMRWDGPESVLVLEAFDYRHYQGATAHITAVTTGGESHDLGSTYLPGHSWNAGVMLAEAAFDASSVADIDYLEVFIEDRGYPTATTETATVVDWVDYTAPVEVGAGEECDLLGWEASCPTGTVCSPTLSGVPGCMPSVAPELLSVTGTYQGGFFASMTFDFEGYDENADWGTLVAESFQGGIAPLEAYGFDGRWNPSPFGQQIYAGQSMAGFGTWMYQVHLEDSDGNTSQIETVLGVPTQEAGAECNTGVCNFFGCQPPESFCDVGAGDTCALGADTPVCEENEAPVLNSVTVHRIDATRFSVDFDGTDRNGDALRVELIQDEAGTVTRKSPAVARDLPIEGAPSFISSFTGTLADPDAETTLYVSLKDYGFLESNVIEVTVPPIRYAGETCSDDDTVDTCVAGSECLDGVCFAYEPQLTNATIAWDATGRNATITITGLDDYTGSQMQLKTATVRIAGQTFTGNMNSYNTEWTGNSFSFDVAAKGIGTGALIGERFMDVTIEDLGGFTDSGVYFITPHAGWSDSCDVDEVTDLCHAGLACDAGTCVNDSVDACAGVPSTVATADTVEWLFETSGNGIEAYSDYASCGGNNNPNGKEQVVVYTATQTGTVTITSQSTDANAHPGYLFVRADECVNEAAVIACSNNLPNGSTIGPNTVDVAVTAGDVLYVTIDGPSWKKGAGTLTFSYL